MFKKFCHINLIVFSCVISVSAQFENKEYNLKAAFIYNFTKYIEWDTISTNEFVIGVLGHSPIYEPLSEIARTKTMNGKKISIREFKTTEVIDSCHILFISGDVSFPLSGILTKTAKGTLIVSEKTGAAEAGSAINFIIVNNNIKFEANTNAIETAGLKASSQLLKLAVIIE